MFVLTFLVFSLVQLSLSHPVPFSSSSAKVDVFVMGEGGYYCIKIPYLLLTSNGTFIAFGEGRIGDCGDYAETDLVYKRSTDGGKTWSPLAVLRADTTPNNTNIVGNAGPVQVNLKQK